MQDESNILFGRKMINMQNIKLKIYPSIGRGSYTVEIERPNWINNLNRKNEYINAWVKDCLVNVDHWEYFYHWEALGEDGKGND